jgi:hypothetical protein
MAQASLLLVEVGSMPTGMSKAEVVLANHVTQVDVSLELSLARMLTSVRVSLACQRGQQFHHAL